MPAKAAIVNALLDRHGRTFSAELGISVAKNTPSPLFRLLCFALLAGARIRADTAMQAAKALASRGWTTPEKLAAATWRQRTDVLNHAGYARYDESTSRMLGDTAKMLIGEYCGDLRRLRSRAECDPSAERDLLKQFKGVGEVGSDIFVREAQAAWEELYPFADKLALRAAVRLDLGGSAKALARRVERADYPRLVAALVHCELAGDHDAIVAAAL